MPAGKKDLYIEQGASFTMQLTRKNADGTAVDLTGTIWKGQIKASSSDLLPIAEFDIEVQDQTQSATKGVVIVSLDPTDTASIPASRSTAATQRLTKYCYDILCETADGGVDRILEGVVSVSPEVTGP